MVIKDYQKTEMLAAPDGHNREPCEPSPRRDADNFVACDAAVCGKGGGDPATDSTLVDAIVLEASCTGQVSTRPCALSVPRRAPHAGRGGVRRPATVHPCNVTSRACEAGCEESARSGSLGSPEQTAIRKLLECPASTSGRPQSRQRLWWRSRYADQRTEKDATVTRAQTVVTTGESRSLDCRESAATLPPSTRGRSGMVGAGPFGPVGGSNPSGGTEQTRGWTRAAHRNGGRDAHTAVVPDYSPGQRRHRDR